MSKGLKLAVSPATNSAEHDGTVLKGQKQLITEYWLNKKKEALDKGETFTEEDKALHISTAKSLYPRAGAYIVRNGTVTFDEKH